ncbi:uncharacterized protein TNCV_186771 [Trichonephila clavipes]|nr:uncharacterized protein TNCV_186771 [Trichonephila clavipes]
MSVIQPKCQKYAMCVVFPVVTLLAENCFTGKFAFQLNLESDYGHPTKCKRGYQIGNRTKTQAVNCVNDYVSRCMQRAEKELFKVTTGGQTQLVEQLCTSGTYINRGYLENIGCWQRIVNDTAYCNENFEKSQKILKDEDMIERLRLFHGCCSFDWHKKCKSKAAEVKCSSEAKAYVEQISTLMGGPVLNQLCGASFSSCYDQLYGIDVESHELRPIGTKGAELSAIPINLLSILNFLKLNPKNLVGSIEYGGGSVLASGCKSASEVGNLVFFDGIVNHELYLNILKRNFKLSTQNLDIGDDQIFKQGNEAKHTALNVRHWCLCNCPQIMKTPPQSLYLVL